MESKLDITKRQDDDSHWYWIPNRLLCEFDNELNEITGIDYMDNPDAFDAFIEKYDKYRTGGSPDLMPEFFKSQTMETNPKQLPPELVEKMIIPIICHRNGESELNDSANKCAQIAVDYAQGKLVDFCQSLMNYTRESHNIIGHDERTAQDFVDIYLKKHEDGK